MNKPILGMLLFTLFVGGCAAPTTDQSGKLLTMAAEEAAGITAPLDRFGRQLNIADTQIRTGRNADADATLKLARETLATPGKSFDNFHLIAGWTAIAELAASANDRALALSSADQALATLNQMTPVPDRAQYVLSLSSVLADVRSNADAVALLSAGAGWAADLPAADRRAALTAFAARLVGYNAFDAAREALRKDPDAAWRTDTFLAMANGYGVFPGVIMASARGLGGGAGGRGATEGRLMSPQAATPLSYGKDVRFQSVFKQ